MTSAQPNWSSIPKSQLYVPRFGSGKAEQLALHHQLVKQAEQLRAIEQSLNIRLWRARMKDGALVLSVDTRKQKHLDLSPLVQWAREALNNPQLQVQIKDKPEKDCCNSGCKGCIKGNKTIKSCWAE